MVLQLLLRSFSAKILFETDTLVWMDPYEGLSWKIMGLWSQTNLGSNLNSAFASFVTLGKLRNLPESQFHHL